MFHVIFTSKIRKTGYFSNCRLKQTSPLKTGESLKITFKDSLGTPSQGPLRAPERLSRGPGDALQGARRGVSVFNDAGKEGGPLRGP